jgi:hypothetical protein
MTHLTLPPSIADERWVPHSSPVFGLEWDTQHATLNQGPLFPLSSRGDDSILVRRTAVIPSSAFPACPQASPPGRVPHVRGLSRTWVEDDPYPMLSPPVHTALQEKKKEGLRPDFLWLFIRRSQP